MKQKSCKFVQNEYVIRWLEEKEVSIMTGISLSSLRKYRMKGVNLPYSKIGKSVRYAYDDIVTFMQSRKVEVRI